MPGDKGSSNLASLFRQAGQEAKAKVLELENKLVIEDKPLSSSGRPHPKKPHIFDILQYIESDWGLGMRLYPVQRFIVKLYYNLPLDDKNKVIEIKDKFATDVQHRFTESDYLKFLYDDGRCNIREPDHERRELILAIGRRGGKTTLSGIFASYEVYRLLNMHHPQEYYGLPPGNRIQIISVATDKDQASLLFNEVTSHLTRCEYFKPYIASNTLSDIKFRTPYDIDTYGVDYRMTDGRYQSLNGKATIRVTFKGCSAKGTRGAGNIVIILDEMAHFIDEGPSSAKEIYDALSPSKAAFSPKNPEDNTEPVGPNEGRIICISSPLNKTGKFYDLFHTAMRGGEGADNKIAIQAPTWEMNPTVSSDYYREKYHEDPLTFDTEHGANFSDRVRGWIERESDLLNCVNPALRPQLIGFPKYPHQLGLDIAVKGDGTSVAITYPDNGKVALAYHEYWMAGEDWKKLNPHLTDYSCDYVRKMQEYDQLDFDEIVAWVAGLTKRFHITDGLFDRWHGMSIAQDFVKLGLPHIQSEFFTRDTSSKMFQVVKTYMLDDKLVLYDYPIPPPGSQTKHSPLIAELLTLQAEQISKNLVVVEAPKQKGYHDDMSDAFVRAVWLTAEKMGNLKHLARPSDNVRSSMGPTYQGYHMARMRAHRGLTMDRPNPRMMRGRGGRGFGR